MVAVVQLVEHQIVILDVAGSSPVSHPDEQGPDRSVRALPLFPDRRSATTDTPPARAADHQRLRDSSAQPTSPSRDTVVPSSSTPLPVQTPNACHVLTASTPSSVMS